MKRFIILFTALILSFSFVSCTETKTTVEYNNGGTATVKPADSPLRTFPPVSEPAVSEEGKMTFESLNDQLAYETAQLLDAEPVYTYCPEYDPVGYDGVKAIWITGPKNGKKDTKVFAYIGFPEVEEGKTVPGIVLMHGGGGYAYPNWVKMWVDHGYAAIAIGNTGYYPKKEGITDFYSLNSWTHTLSREGNENYTLAPDNDQMNTSTLSLNRQWMYHAVCQSIIGNNILRSLDFVDSDRIGITGISWGGVITSTAIGYDNRFAFAIPVYGSAFLAEGLTWIRNNYNYKGTKELWDPANRIDYVSTNILWLFWTNDVAFSPNSASKSYLHTRDSSILCMKMDMQHGHIEGWSQPEIMRYADSIVMGGEGLLEITKDPSLSDGTVSCEFKSPKDTKKVTARMCYITEQMSYSTNGIQSLQNPEAWKNTETIEQEWHSAECKISKNTCSVSLPSDAYTYYIEFTLITKDGTEYITTSELVDVF